MGSWDDLNFWSSKLHDKLQVFVRQPSTYPFEHLVFRAFKETPFDKVKCVILGQDPYHTPGIADGLAFSVGPHIQTLPPSLRNIFKEYQSDLNLAPPRNGFLSSWAKEGVLLLNTILTVKRDEPLSHKGIGWEKLAIEVLQKLNKEKEHCAFVFWGKHAQEYSNLINGSETPSAHRPHLIIKAPHPAPYSAHLGFFGHKPFSRVNKFLEECQIKPIDWKLR